MGYGPQNHSITSFVSPVELVKGKACVCYFGAPAEIDPALMAVYTVIQDCARVSFLEGSENSILLKDE